MSDGELLAVANPSSFSSLCTSIETKNFRLKTVQQQRVIGDDAVQIFLFLIEEHGGPSGRRRSSTCHIRSPVRHVFSSAMARKARVGAEDASHPSPEWGYVRLRFSTEANEFGFLTLSQSRLHTTQCWEGWGVKFLEIILSEGRKLGEVHCLSGVEDGGPHGRISDAAPVRIQLVWKGHQALLLP